MRLFISLSISLSAVFALAACSDEPTTPTAAASTSPQDIDVEQPVMGPERHILAFGDSLFAGYGVDPEESYPARLERALRAKGVNARITNAGVSGDTSAAGAQRIAFVLSGQDVAPDLAIVELGGNDLLRGIDPDQTRKNLSAILSELQQRDIPVLLMGMRAPPNLGEDYRQRFDALYPDLAKQFGVDLVPFFLEGVYDHPELIQDDRVHPTAEGIETLVAATEGDVRQALPERP
ncbi:arylesterase [Altererythrobacter endophyticus]|uniref:Arylesterase n=2 Tax=Altericroceibacterium endophyticum TaxID=1808508 RepID=A0A6I4T164_9SPHN|nr:arylesterase [Altericroceibacterium endophyticum]